MKLILFFPLVAISFELWSQNKIGELGLPEGFWSDTNKVSPSEFYITTGFYMVIDNSEIMDNYSNYSVFYQDIEAEIEIIAEQDNCVSVIHGKSETKSVDGRIIVIKNYDQGVLLDATYFKEDGTIYYKKHLDLESGEMIHDVYQNGIVLLRSSSGLYRGLYSSLYYPDCEMSMDNVEYILDAPLLTDSVFFIPVQIKINEKLKINSVKTTDTQIQLTESNKIPIHGFPFKMKPTNSTFFYIRYQPDINKLRQSDTIFIFTDKTTYTLYTGNMPYNYSINSLDTIKIEKNVRESPVAFKNRNHSFFIIQKSNADISEPFFFNGISKNLFQLVDMIDWEPGMYRIIIGPDVPVELPMILE